MKITYIKPATDVVESIYEAPLMVGSDLDHADAKRHQYFDDESEEEGNNDDKSNEGLLWGSVW